MPETTTRGPGSSWSDERIIVALAALRDELLVPDAPLELPSSDSHGRTRRLLVAVAAAVVLTAGLVIAIAPAREAVADWLGIGTTEVRITPSSSLPPGDSLPALADGAVPIDAVGAEQELGRRLPAIAHPATTVAPTYARPLEGGVLVRWPGRGETLWLRAATSESPVFIKKLVGGDDVDHIGDLGDDALWLGSSHLLETPGRRLSAQHVLLWIDDGLELRLEGDLPRDEMVAIARGVG